MNKKKYLSFLLLLSLGLSACAPAVSAKQIPTPGTAPVPARYAAISGRPNYNPGELVEYTAQNGDTLPALAARFNTTVDEILAANTFIPHDATTMPPGMPMKIPIYYLPLWADPYQILPDHAFVNGPTLIGFDTNAFVSSQKGWLKDYLAYAGGDWRSGAGIVDYVAVNFSVSPRLLLALLEYQTGALTDPAMPKDDQLLGLQKKYYDTLYLQLVQAADLLNDSYYRWRTGDLLEFELLDGTIFRPDPWDNAASVSLKRYFSILYSGEQFTASIGPSGLARTYTDLFGDPWEDETILIPGSLRQPELPLPFQAGQAWSYTGGPHSGYGASQPYPAVDFAPPSDKSGCFVAEEKYYVIAVADGVVARSETGTVVLDLDGDGNERTGWVIYYLHLAANDRAPLGKKLHQGDKVGLPSCEGGHVTGTHVHIARKYNGEWIPAYGPLPFVFEGWTVHAGLVPYKGTLTRGSLVVTACECGDLYSLVRAGLAP